MSTALAAGDDNDEVNVPAAVIGKVDSAEKDPSASAAPTIRIITTQTLDRKISKHHTTKSDITRKKFKGFETADFEEPDHGVLRLHYMTQTTMQRGIQELAIVLSSILLAIFIAFVFAVLSKSTEYIGDLRFEQLTKFVEEGRTGAAYVFILGSSLVAAIIPALLVVNFAPSAIGSGMTEVIAFLNGATTMPGLSFRTLAVKYIGIFGLVVGGLFSGIDGPMAKIGAGLAILYVRYFRKWPHGRRLFYAQSEEITKAEADSPDAENKYARLINKSLISSLLSFLEMKRVRIFATLGAAISITAIFRAPVGGVLFAIEECTSFFEPSILIRTAISTVVSYFITAWIDARFTYSTLTVDTLKEALFPTDSECDTALHSGDIGLYLCIALLAVLLGYAVNVSLSVIQKFRLRYIIDPNRHATAETQVPSGRIKFLRVAEVALLCLITSTVVVFVPLAFDYNCTSLTQPLDHITSSNVDCQFLVDGIDGKLLTNEACAKIRSCDSTFSSSGVCLPKSFASDFSRKLFNLTEYCKPTLGSISAAEGGNDIPAGEGSGSGNTTEGIESVGEKAEVTFDYKKNADIVLRIDEPNACYWQMRSLLWQTPERQLKQLLARGVSGLWDPVPLLIFGLIYIVLSALTYYIALPTDVVVPNLIVGAVFGRLLGLLINGFHTETPLDPGAVALITMAAFWSGTSRLVLTVAAVALELTGDFSLLPILLVVCFLSAWVASAFGGSLYHVEMENNGAPYLGATAPHSLEYTLVSHIMHKNPKTVRAKEKLEDLGGLLSSTSFEGFPVVEEYSFDADGDGPGLATKMQKPVGYVRRSKLLEVLDAVRDDPIPDLEQIIHILPVSTSSPHLVSEKSTAAKVFRMFRQLGLKHCLIVDGNGFLTGIVTRRDLLRPELEREEEEEKERKKRGTLADLAAEFIQDITSDDANPLRRRQNRNSNGDRSSRRSDGHHGEH